MDATQAILFAVNILERELKLAGWPKKKEVELSIPLAKFWPEIGDDDLVKILKLLETEGVLKIKKPEQFKRLKQPQCGLASTLALAGDNLVCDVAPKRLMKYKEKQTQGLGEEEVEISSPLRPQYIPEIAILKYGDKEKKLQKDKARDKILGELWKTKRIIRDGKITEEGSFKSFPELAYIGGFVKHPEEFQMNKVLLKISVRDVIEDLRGKFEEMGVPLKIIVKNGFLLEETIG